MKVNNPIENVARTDGHGEKARKREQNFANFSDSNVGGAGNLSLLAAKLWSGESPSFS